MDNLQNLKLTQLRWEHQQHRFKNKIQINPRNHKRTQSRNALNSAKKKAMDKLTRKLKQPKVVKMLSKKLYLH